MQPQPSRGRISPRRLAALGSVAALTLAVCSSAGTGHLSPTTTAPGAGPSALSRSSAHGPCMIGSDRDVQMSEGVPTDPGYTRSTGTVRALTLMIDFSDAPGEGDALDRYREFFPQTREWFTTSSYGRLDYRPELPVPEWLRMPRSFRQYGIERGAPFDPGYREQIRDIGTGLPTADNTHEVAQASPPTPASSTSTTTPSSWPTPRRCSPARRRASRRTSTTTCATSTPSSNRPRTPWTSASRSPWSCSAWSSSSRTTRRRTGWCTP
ncbi:hypothetical protein SALBM217S_05181 [Streptomyces griseoloalbus]